MTSYDLDAPEVDSGITWPPRRADPLLPPPAFDEVRARCPVSRVSLYDGSAAWLATRHDDMRALLRNPAMSANPRVGGYPNSSANHSASRNTQGGFIRMDAPEHDVQRRMLTKAFSVRQVELLRPYVEQLVDELLDGMAAAGGPVDLVAALAEPLPARAICKILDLPSSDAAFLLGRVATWMNLNSPPDVSAQASGDLAAFLDNLIRRRLEKPGEDIVSHLVAQQFQQGAISRQDLVGMLQLLVVGGFDTTANMIALGTIAFLRFPDQAAELRAHPELAAPAMEELLRYLSVAHHVASRVATDDIMIRGVCIHAGDGVIAPIPAANHDPEVFEDPHVLNIRRDARDHVSFGFGIHQCLGQNLARIELQVVFVKLLQRFPDLRLAVAESDLDFRNSMIYGVPELLVTWGEA